MEKCFALPLLLATLLPAGCSPRLSEEREVTLAIDEIKTVMVDPIRNEQTIDVLATSPGAPISMHIYLLEDEEEVERNITLGMQLENVLAMGENSEKIHLQAVVPANKKAIVRLQLAGRRKATVRLSIQN